MSDIIYPEECPAPGTAEFTALKHTLLQLVKDNEGDFRHRWSSWHRTMPKIARSILGLENVDHETIFAVLLESLPNANNYSELSELIEGCYSDDEFFKWGPGHPTWLLSAGSYIELLAESPKPGQESQPEALQGS